MQDISYEENVTTFSSDEGDVKIKDGEVIEDSSTVAARIELADHFDLTNTLQTLSPMEVVFDRLGGKLVNDKYQIPKDGTYLLTANLSGVNFPTRETIVGRIDTNDFRNIRGSDTSGSNRYPTASPSGAVRLTEGDEVELKGSASVNYRAAYGQHLTSLSIIKL